MRSSRTARCFPPGEPPHNDTGGQPRHHLGCSKGVFSKAPAHNNQDNLGCLAEILKDGTVTIEYVDAALQAADVFTKALVPQKWDNAIQLLGMRSDLPEDLKLIAIPRCLEKGRPWLEAFFGACLGQEPCGGAGKETPRRSAEEARQTYIYICNQATAEVLWQLQRRKRRDAALEAISLGAVARV